MIKVNELKTDQWEIQVEDEGLRLDHWLTNRIEISRSQIKNYIGDGYVVVNEYPVKAGYRLKRSDRVKVTIPSSLSDQDFQVVAQPIPLEILYEDSDLLVINKGKDMVVHPGAGNREGTLVNALLHHCQNLSTLGGETRPGIVHRLDKDTTGVLLVAKNDDIHLSIAHQLKARQVERHYVALTHGIFKEDLGSIEAPIGRHPVDRKKMAVVDSGREAITHFQVLERFSKHTLVECRLVTGRTHQIRVHLASINHPIVGDSVYGRVKSKSNLGATSQTLHACYVAFDHPSKGFMEFEAPWPQELQNLVEKARGYQGS